MSSTMNDHITVLDSGRGDAVWAVAFHADGMHLFSGNSNEIQRWQLAGGQRVGKQTGMNIYAISVSRDHKWMVCGTTQGASVWGETIQEKTIEVEGTLTVSSVDISSDATRFVTGTAAHDYKANIWNIVTGERLVGPLQHNDTIVGVKFSPNGERVATACHDHFLRIFDSRNGDQLIIINANFKSPCTSVTPLAWSNNGQQIFAASGTNKLLAFNSSTGSQLAESHWQVHTEDNGSIGSIALAANGKFLATFGANSVSFWDTSTLARIDVLVEDIQEIQSIALSPDCGRLATGGRDGKITIHNLGDILPGSYGTIHAPELATREDRSQQQQDETTSSSGVHDTKTSAVPPGEQSATAGPSELEIEGKVTDDDLLEADGPTSAPAPMFDYDEALSQASSIDLREGEVVLPGPSQTLPRLPDALSVTYPQTPCTEEHHDTAKSSGSIPMFKKWLQTMVRRGDRNQDLHQPSRLSREPVQPAEPRSQSNSHTRGNTAIKGPSRIAAAQRRLRTVARTIREESQQQKPEEQPKTTNNAEGSNSNKDASSSGQDGVDPKTAGPVQQVNSASQPLSVPTGVHVVKEAGDATVAIAFKLPAWMLCRCSAGEDGMH